MTNYAHRAAKLLLLLTAIIPLAIIAARGQSNLVLLISAAGDRIGAGQTYYATNETNIVISGTATTVTVEAFGFNMIFDGPGLHPLTTGPYSNAVKYPSNGDSPGLSATGNGNTCTNVCGNFHILELATNAGGNIVSFWATFLQHCECDTTPPLTGEIRYHSQIASGGPLPRTLLVPDDFPTIQSALNDVSRLAVDTVLVGPGVYRESVQFGSNNAHLVSAAGPAATFIEAPGQTAVAFGVNNKAGTVDALLQGFTLTNSTYGIYLAGAFPQTITSNVIVNCEVGINCGADTPSSTIIRSNSIRGCSGFAVQFYFTQGPLLEGNRLEGNGGGVYLWAAGTPEIRNNIISSNRSDGLTMVNTYGVNIIQNLIIANSGRGLALDKPQGGLRGPWAINNTIVDNGGAGIFVAGFATDAEVVNNIVVGDPPLQFDAGIFQFNNFYPSKGTALSGPVTNLIGVSGNISSNPYLVCQPSLDYHLLAGSPCIDAGTNGAHVVVGSDFDGQPRILPGASNAPPRMDMGAFEFAQLNPVACLFLFCPTNVVVIAAPGENSSVVAYPAPYVTPGAMLSNSHPSGSVFPAGDNPVSVTAFYGTNILNCGFLISVLTTNDFTRGLNTSNLTWSTGGAAPWFVQNSVTHDGLAAAQSGAISHNQTSTLETVISGAATLNFWWKVSSESSHDFLSVSVNGAPTAAISGTVGWVQQTIYLGAGPQALQWAYAKDASGSAGQDAAWLDQINPTSGATAPALSSQPASVAVAPGQNATFSATAFGTPPLQYQWLFNSTNIPGATNSTLTITNVRVSNVGTYTLLVSNPVGSTNSIGVILNLAKVVAWGANAYGQTNVPFSLTDVLAVAGGYHHSVCLRADRTVVAWGANNAGQTNVPSSLSNAVAISSRSGDFSMALRSNGTVVVWGDNSFHQTNLPSGLSNVVAVAAGGGHCIALKSDGTAISWGYVNTVPAGLSNVVAVAAGDYGNLALKSDGTVVSWGQPGTSAGLSNVIAIAAGLQHSLALKQDGTVVAWGDNSRGQTNVPSGLSNVVAIAAGDWHSYALRSDGTVVKWGKYETGSYFPAEPIPGLSNVVAIAAGSDHDLALLGEGPPVLQATATNLRRSGISFGLSLPTQSGRTYRMEFRDSLSASNWNPLPLVPGNGTVETLLDTNSLGIQRFYRVRRW